MTESVGEQQDQKFETAEPGSQHEQPLASPSVGHDAGRDLQEHDRQGIEDLRIHDHRNGHAPRFPEQPLDHVSGDQVLKKSQGVQFP